MQDGTQLPDIAKADSIELKDSFGRRFEYLRLSLTDRCNFRCNYCLPQGYRKDPALPPELTRKELTRAVRGFARLGLWKLRLTGGEPTVRPDFNDIVRDMAQVDGITHIAMTTNGYRLAERAREWRDAGVDAINLSIDTLDRASFARITGHDRLDEIVDGVDSALAAGFDAVKVNSVLMRSLEGSGWDDVLRFIETRNVSWRFIELMRTNDNAGFHRGEATPGEGVVQRLVQSGWKPITKEQGGGPAVEYVHPDYVGKIGVIAPYASGFCDSCNRLRLSSRGKLQLCLFGEGGVDLRDLLRDDAQEDELVERIVAVLPSKPFAHRLHSGVSGDTPHLASIGG